MLRRPNKDFLGVSWTLWFMPSLFLRAVYRKFTKKKLQNFSKEDLAFKENVYTGLTVVYLLIGFTSLGLAYLIHKETRKQPLPFQGTRLENIHSAQYITEDMATKALESNNKIKIVRFDGFKKMETLDVTEDVLISLKGSGFSNDPNYDKYEDPKYIERRLKLQPGTYNPIIAKEYLKRIERLNSTR